MTARALSPSEKLDWLRLFRSDHVGPLTFYQLLRRYGSAAAALDALPGLARRGGRGDTFLPFPKARALAEMEAVDTFGAVLLAWGEPNYPPALLELPDPPPLIAARGRRDLLTRNAVAIVGARNASAAGRRFARDLAAGLGNGGLAVVSGLARGIDAAAHAGALSTGTIGVIAGGIDHVYPEENRALYEALYEEGAVIAEQPFGAEPKARHFPRRNRIISGAALGVVVVEAARRSGSLITARFALEQGREIFAVPGSPLDPRCGGTNDLIRRGAILTESAADVMEALSGMTGLPKVLSRKAIPPLPGGEDEAEFAGGGMDGSHSGLLEYLGPTPVTVDELVRQCQLSPAMINAILLELELAGRVERHPGNRVSLL